MPLLPLLRAFLRHTPSRRLRCRAPPHHYFRRQYASACAGCHTPRAYGAARHCHAARATPLPPPACRAFSRRFCCRRCDAVTAREGARRCCGICAAHSNMRAAAVISLLPRAMFDICAMRAREPKARRRYADGGERQPRRAAICSPRACRHMPGVLPRVYAAISPSPREAGAPRGSAVWLPAVTS